LFITIFGCVVAEITVLSDICVLEFVFVMKEAIGLFPPVAAKKIPIPAPASPIKTTSVTRQDKHPRRLRR
jgi:hypothetical protein